MAKNKKNHHSALKVFGLFVLSVIGLSMPFVWYYAGWLTLICMLPFLYFLRYLTLQRVSFKQQLGLIWVTGFGVFLIVLSWTLLTTPEQWAFVSGYTASIALGGVYLVFAALLSLQYLIFGLLFLKFKPKLNTKTVFIILPAIWVVAEAARSILFSLISAGPNGSIGMYWNFGALGIGASVTQLGYLARLVGMFGLSFVVVVINLCIFWMLQKRWRLPALLIIVIVCFSVSSWYIWRPPLDAQKVNIGFIQLPQSFDGYQTELSYFEKIKQEALPIDHKLDLLVLPEYSDFFVNEIEKAQSVETAKSIVVENGSLVTSENAQDNNIHKNRLIVYTPDRTVQASQDKTFLIPIGEYMPYAIMGVFKLFGQDNVLQLHEQTRVVTKGSVDDRVVRVANGLRLGSMACSGAIAPELYRVLALENAQVLTNSASLGIFTKAPLYHAQSRQFAHFIAVSNARPYVQGASGAYSYIIDSSGNFVVMTNDFGLHFGQAQLALVSRRTLYTLLGEWVVLVSAGVLAVCIGKKLQSRRKNNT